MPKSNQRDREISCIGGRENSPVACVLSVVARTRDKTTRPERQGKAIGQYYHIVSLDRRQFLHPHKFNDGLKLLEFGCSGEGVLLGLTVLLASGNGRGGGDFGQRKEPPAGLAELVGSWAGTRVVIAGDYDDDGKWLHRAGFTDREIEGFVAKQIADCNGDSNCLEYAEREPTIYQLCGEGVFQDISDMVIELLLAGGEGVRFAPAMIEDAERRARCLAHLHALPAWAQEGHPVIAGSFTFGSYG